MRFSQPFLIFYKCVDLFNKSGPCDRTNFQQKTPFFCSFSSFVFFLFFFSFFLLGQPPFFFKPPSYFLPSFLLIFLRCVGWGERALGILLIQFRTFTALTLSSKPLLWPELTPIFHGLYISGTPSLRSAPTYSSFYPITSLLNTCHFKILAYFAFYSIRSFLAHTLSHLSPFSAIVHTRLTSRIS